MTWAAMGITWAVKKAKKTSEWKKAWRIKAFEFPSSEGGKFVHADPAKPDQHEATKEKIDVNVNPYTVISACQTAFLPGEPIHANSRCGKFK